MLVRVHTCISLSESFFYPIQHSRRENFYHGETKIAYLLAFGWFKSRKE